MTLAEILLVAMGAVFAYMVAAWVVSLLLRNASIVDILWGLGFVLLAVLYCLLGDGYSGRKVLVTALAAAWGLRLAAYIGWRNAGKGEDYRYRQWRERAGPKFWWISLFQVFLLQGLLMWLISTPLLAAQHYGSPDSLGPVDVIGALVWSVGFFFESVGDFQLARFKADPANKGKVMRYGLWAYTRHPNYFGDAAVWCGLFIIAAGTVDGLWTVYSPLLMTLLLVRVSGVALLERGQVKAKPGYEEYIRTTSAFLPWPPRRSRDA